MDYLCAHEKIESSKGIGVVGISKSAEIALLMATYFGDKVSAVVAMNGMPLLTGRYKYQKKDLLKGKGTLMPVYHCHKPVFRPEMAIFQRAGMREGGLPLPLGVQYLIFLI